TKNNGNTPANPVFDNGEISPDLFLTDMIQVDAGLKQTTTVVSVAANPYTNIDTLPSFFLQTGGATFGYLSTIQPYALILPPGVPLFGNLVVNTDTNGNITIADIVGAPAAISGSTGVKVDPYGRYLSSDGSVAVFLSDVNPRWRSSGFLYTSKVTTSTAGRFDVYLGSITNVVSGLGGVSVTNASLTGSALDPLNDKSIADNTLNLQGGSADNAILPRANSDRVIFTARVGNSSEGALALNVNVTPGITQQVTELYMREFSNRTELPVRTRLVSGIQVTNPDSPTTTSVAGSGKLRPDPNDLASDNSKRVDPLSYQVSPFGRYVVFSDDSGNLVRQAYRFGPSITDGNSTYDVFRRDLDPDATDNTGGLSIESVNPAGTVAGSKASGSTIEPSSFNPAISPDGRYVAFESAAVNLVTVIDQNKANDIFVSDHQARKDRAGNFLPRVSLVSINTDGTLSGNAESFKPFVGSNGSTPRLSYTSRATNLISNLTVPEGSAHAYVADLPITLGGGDGGGSTAVGVVAGGTQASTSLVSFTGNGILAFGNKFTPFQGFTGELRVATGDINGDGFADIVVGAGTGGGPRVQVIDGATGSRTLTYTFRNVDGTVNSTTKRTFDIFAFESSFTGGVYVSTADFNSDGFSDIIVGAGEGGGARVQVYSGRDAKKVADF
ncbi:MAG: FG-GAP repeat domain-containing protein, partial [Gemmataceae bacterium]